jgi:hypothetical protein
MAGWIFVKFGMDVMPLENIPNSYFLTSYTLQYQRDGCLGVRDDDDAIIHDPLRKCITPLMTSSPLKFVCMHSIN